MCKSGELKYQSYMLASWVVGVLLAQFQITQEEVVRDIMVKEFRMDTYTNIYYKDLVFFLFATHSDTNFIIPSVEVDLQN